MTDLFFAIILAVLLWVVCACFGKLFSSKFQLSIIQHLVCLVVAVITCICLFTVFKMNRLNGYLDNIVMVTESVQQAERLTDSSDLTKKIRKQYPMLSKFVDTNQIVDTVDFSIVPVKKKISSYRNKFVFTLLVFQLIAFGMVYYSASQQAKRTIYSSYDLDNEDYTYN
jgi:predicted PurR-regulated permease PerM